MSKKKTHEEYVTELAIKNPTIEVVEPYIGSHTSIMHHCIIHDVFWKTTPNRALQGVGCECCKVEKFRQVRRKTHEQYVEEVLSVSADIVVIGKYIDARTQIEHYCKKHNVLWNSYPDNILRGIGCKECGNEKIKYKKIKSHNNYVSDVQVINPEIEVIDEYQGSNIAILHRCKIDGYVWPAKPANILFGKGCPQCNESRGERQVRQWLEKYNIEYQYQKTFNDCKDIRLLPFDFYLPKHNICIEYDGEQHFKPVNFDGNDDKTVTKQFETTVKHDKIKTQYCITNNIYLLRIPYYKNVEQELNNCDIFKFLFI